jgi:hypothetical protein
MFITQRRVIALEGDRVVYERVDEPGLIIVRTVADHVEATGHKPTMGEVVEFETWTDGYDGCVSRYRSKNG